MSIKLGSFSILLSYFLLNSNAFAQDKVPVVASFSVLGDLVKQVGGEHVSVTTLVKANGDAHVYNPAPKDAKAVKHAKLLVTNGLAFEGWMPRLLESTKFTGVSVVASSGITPLKNEDDHDADHEDEHHDEHEAHDAEHDDEHHDEHEAHDADHDDDHHDEHKGHDDDHDDEHHDEHKGHDDDHDEHEDHHAHHHGEFDPHAWHSINNAKVYVQNIANGLSQVDTAHRATYQQNAAQYIQKLEQLEVELTAKIKRIPLAERNVLTPHDAFGYLARDFKINFIAPQGTGTDTEASAADVAKIIKQIRKQHIKAVFLENITDNRIVEQISRETHSSIGGKLYSDALSNDNEPASTYLKMMCYNLETIVKGLSH